MDKQLDFGNIEELAAEITAERRSSKALDPRSVKAYRRKLSEKLRMASREDMLVLARELRRNHGQWWLACELVINHEPTFQDISMDEIEELGQGINSWGAVDCFARALSGPAWLKGKVSDELIHKWASSEDRWWRRAALVSTVALNSRSHGGMGDTTRTIEVCKLLVNDHDDMVVKAMSWALRSLVIHDPVAVEGFLHKYDGVLAARAKREVKNKLTTGLKNPRKQKHGAKSTLSESCPATWRSSEPGYPLHTNLV